MFHVYVCVCVVHSALSLMGSNMTLADEILTNPGRSLPMFDIALRRAQKVMLNSMPPHDKTDLVSYTQNTILKSLKICLKRIIFYTVSYKKSI